MMFQKSHSEAAATTLSGLMRTSNENQSVAEQTCARARKLAAARASRGNRCGMFSRTSGLFRH